METLLAPDAIWFTVPAVVGTLFFLVRLVLLAFGGIADVGDDGGTVHADDPHGSGEHGDSGLAAQFLSVQGLTTFLMGFGWTGYAAVAGLGWTRSAAAAVGFAGGVVLVLLLGTLFRGARRLEATGTVDLTKAAGTMGEVYANIPARGDGQGQVRIVVGDRERIVNAVSAADALPTRTRVRVVHVNSDRTVTVQSL